MGAVRLIRSFIVLFLIKLVGKRKLVFYSLAVAAFCYMAIAIVVFLQLRGNYLWIMPIAMLIGVFTNTTGTGTILYMLNDEIFAASIKYIGSLIGNSTAFIVDAVSAKLFLYILESITLYAKFVWFTFINVITLLAYYFSIPETEGKSLKEIEDHFKDVRHSKEHDKC